MNSACGNSVHAGAAILSVAYPFAALGPGTAGGAEQVLSLLESSISASGLQSVVVAHHASGVSGTLLGVPVREGLLTPDIRAEAEAGAQACIDAALAHFPIRLVHMHGIDFHRYRIPEHLPVLVTLHLPLAWYPPEIWALPRNVYLQCVSESQRRTSPPEHRDRLLVVGNGVPIPPPAPPSRKGRFALLLSRICPEKNLHLAIGAARLAGVPVVLAGQVFPYPEHLRYFENEISPRLGRGARFVGQVGGRAKARLLARAACLLLPSLAEETSSLVAMEALAAGTPVIALPSGAIPEIIDHGRTGFLVRDAHQMAMRLREIGTLESAACRAAAESRFSAEDMVRSYLSLYTRLISGESPGTGA